MTKGTLSLSDVTEKRKLALNAEKALLLYFGNLPAAKVVDLDTYKKMLKGRDHVKKMLLENPV
jgi:hypothetical protein